MYLKKRENSNFCSGISTNFSCSAWTKVRGRGDLNQREENLYHRLEIWNFSQEVLTHCKFINTFKMPEPLTKIWLVQYLNWTSHFKRFPHFSIIKIPAIKDSLLSKKRKKSPWTEQEIKWINFFFLQNQQRTLKLQLSWQQSNI